jgi:uncharacterized membrane protein YfhO
MLNLDIYDINWQYDIGERVKYRGQVNEKGKPNGLGCMGYFDEDTGSFKIAFEEPGTYTFDHMYVSAMNVSNYDKYAAERMESAYQVTEYDDSHVLGTVSASRDGVLFLSIPAHDNWDIYVDGEKAEEIDDLDTTFFGTVVPAGSHEVTLRYDNRFVKTGAVFSIIGIVMLAVICYTERRRKSK